MTNRIALALIIAPLALGAAPALSEGSHDINPFDSQPYATNAPEPAPTPAPEVIPEVTPAPEPEEALAEPMEDDPNFDCRIHGNHKCGVEVNGTWYVLDYDTMTFVTR